MDKNLKNFISFMSGDAVVRVTNEGEFNAFRRALKYHKVEGLLGKTKSFLALAELARINFMRTDMFLFEVSKGALTWSDDEDEVLGWLGSSPLSPDEI